MDADKAMTGQELKPPPWTGAMTTVVEIEFHHIMIDVDAQDESLRLGPRPDQLHAGLNTPVTSVTSNGLLLWMPDGSVVHGDWRFDERVFSRRDGKADLPLSDVRAWTAVPFPIAAA